MNDLEICKKLAEIEGHKTLPLGEYEEGAFYIVIDNHGEVYNPLTDDALCFELIEKYDVTFNIYHDLGGIKYYYGDLWRDSERITIPDSKELKRFVCLYVIELKKR